MTINTAGYYENLLPANRAFLLSGYTPWEERQRGWYELFGQLNRELNMFLLGKSKPGCHFYILLNKPIEKPQQIAGMRLRTAPAFDKFLRALNAATVSLTPPEVYTAMERRVIDGFFSPIESIRMYAYQEVGRYFIDHGFYNDNQIILFNLDTWNRLPKDVQDLIVDYQVNKFEREVWDFLRENERKERTFMQDKGVKFIQFSADDAKWYLGLAEKAKWEDVKSGVTPELYTKLRKILGAE